MSDFKLDSESAKLEAKARGCHVVYPKDNELQIDIDNKEQYLKFKEMQARLEQNIPDLSITRMQKRVSASGEEGHYHITVTLNRNVTPIERIALQSCLSSDPIREILSLCRYFVNDPNPTLFIEKDSE